MIEDFWELSYYYVLPLAMVVLYSLYYRKFSFYKIN